MKYESQLNEAKEQILPVDDILIALPQSPTVDELAAGLALYLALEQFNKRVSIASQGTIRVGHTNLYGVGEIKNSFPQNSGGKLTIVLGGVVDPETGKPADLKELTWSPEGSDLRLIFHQMPGKKFEPTHVTPEYQGGSFPVTFVIGAGSLSDLGSVYTDNQEAFDKSYIINIDDDSSNANFGKTNLVDATSSSLCEMMTNVLIDLALPFDKDAATNLLSGLYEATNNLQDTKVTADTFLAVAEAIKKGGTRPVVQIATPSQGLDLTSQTDAAPAVEETQPSSVSFAGTDDTQVQEDTQPAQAQDFQPTQVLDDQTVGAQTVSDDQVDSAQSLPVEEVEPETLQTQEDQPSPEEAPAGESASGSPESDWLTPKIYKGGSLG